MIHSALQQAPQHVPRPLTQPLLTTVEAVCEPPMAHGPPSSHLVTKWGVKRVQAVLNHLEWSQRKKNRYLFWANQPFLAPGLTIVGGGVNHC